MTQLRRLGPFLASLPAHGGLVNIHIGPVKAVVICDPDATGQLLRDDRTFDKGGPLYDQGRELIGNGLGLCPHDKHRRLRRLAQPTFHRKRLPGYAEVKMATVESIIGNWRHQQIIDISAEMRTMVSKGLFAAIFPSSIAPETQSQILADLDTVLSGVFRRMVLPRALNRLRVIDNRHETLANTRLHETIDTIINHRRTEGIDDGDLLSALLNARDLQSAEQQLSDSQIADTIMAFFIGGVDTTAATLSWALHMLAQHPDIERQVQAEVDTVLSGRRATFEDLSRLEVTARVIKETLRLWPPVWLLTRVATADAQLGGYVIPAGTNVIYSPYVLHHRSDLYENPDRFDPNRWTLESAASHNGFIPFGAGGRKCIGDSLAMTDAVLTLATITARWRLTQSPHHRVRPKLGTFTLPQGLHMRLIDRSSDPGPSTE
ncbi:cytochrome P450 [Nocardia sp. CDC159]|uniref:Cytochrome P450 n=2 Tax=Nocardiaceae TaxID=85025 RepID=A0A9X2EDI9_9NOCA|nr:cytochrome P450 [Nocardia pulmonis]MCM6791333.1 cytochrome P450 [Nocardia sp. CDC159]